MLVEEMTVAEINKAVYSDYNIIRQSSTQDRLEHLYLEQRKKLNIDKNESWPFLNPIKTKVKNNWLLMIEKDPKVGPVRSKNEIRTAYFTYYHTDKGIRVFNPCAGDMLLVFKGHVFTRYKERMGLTFNDPMTIIKHFFATNFSPIKKTFDKDIHGVKNFMSIEKDGYLMGDIQEYPGNIVWYVHKTFIAKGTAALRHIEFTNQLRLKVSIQLLNYKAGIINELDSKTKEYCDLFGFNDKEVSISFLEHLIEDLKNGRE